MMQSIKVMIDLVKEWVSEMHAIELELQQIIETEGSGH